MQNSEGLVSSLHLKMLQRRRKREKRRTSAIGAVCAGLTLCLVALVFGNGLHTVGTAGVYSGAAMLFENAGAYVLTAILAFMLGVVVTVILLRRRKQEEHKTNADETETAFAAEASINGDRWIER